MIYRSNHFKSASYHVWEITHIVETFRWKVSTTVMVFLLLLISCMTLHINTNFDMSVY